MLEFGNSALQEHLLPTEQRLKDKLAWLKKDNKKVQLHISGGALAHMCNVGMRRPTEMTLFGLLALWRQMGLFMSMEFGALIGNLKKISMPWTGSMKPWSPSALPANMKLWAATLSSLLAMETLRKQISFLLASIKQIAVHPF